jgi:hypothetical protein
MTTEQSKGLRSQASVELSMDVDLEIQNTTVELSILYSVTSGG